jgi:hypothetical protein
MSLKKATTDDELEDDEDTPSDDERVARASGRTPTVASRQSAKKASDINQTGSGAKQVQYVFLSHLLSFCPDVSVSLSHASVSNVIPASDQAEPRMSQPSSQTHLLHQAPYAFSPERGLTPAVCDPAVDINRVAGVPLSIPQASNVVCERPVSSQAPPPPTKTNFAPQQVPTHNSAVSHADSTISEYAVLPTVSVPSTQGLNEIQPDTSHHQMRPAPISSPASTDYGQHPQHTASQATGLASAFTQQQVHVQSYQWASPSMPQTFSSTSQGRFVSNHYDQHQYAPQSRTRPDAFMWDSSLVSPPGATNLNHTLSRPGPGTVWACM